MGLEDELIKIADLSHSGVQERRIETKVVQAFESAGWDNNQIDQDVSLSDKGMDKADIVLTLNNRITLMVEIKREGKTRNAVDQVQRYCRLLTPSPKLAFLTDGIRWVVYYVGQPKIMELYDETITDHGASTVASILASTNPENLTKIELSKIFDYLNLVECSLHDVSEEVRIRLLPHFVTTVKSLLFLCPVKSGQEKDTSVAAPSPVEKVAVPPPSRSENVGLGVKKITSDSAPKTFDPFRPPSFTFTSMHGKWRNEQVSNWNDLLHAAIRSAVEAGYSSDDIRQLTNANIRDDDINEGGFSAVSGTSLSVQRLETNRAWVAAFALARKLRFSLEITVRWGVKAPESFRGTIGIIRWPSGD